jgi:hypothetical protein
VDLSDKRRDPRYVVMLEVLIAALPELEVRDALLVECSAGGGVLEVPEPLPEQTKIALRLPTADGGVTLRALVVRELDRGLVAVRWVAGAGGRAETALSEYLAATREAIRLPGRARPSRRI